MNADNTPRIYRPEATVHLQNSWAGAHCEGADMTTPGRTPGQIRDLKLICVGCPRLQRCGQYVINRLANRDDSDDIAAGMTRDERIQVRRVIAERRAAKSEKTCTKCGVTKSGAEFYPRSGSTTSTESACLDCRRTKMRQKTTERRRLERAAREEAAA